MSDKQTTALTPRDIGLLAAAAALILDQGSKLLMLYGFGFAQMAHECHQYADPVSILPFFNLVMVWNLRCVLRPVSGQRARRNRLFGAVFHCRRGRTGLVAVGRAPPALTIGLGLVIGGALGNLIDRLIYGKVADFFHFHLGTYHWYVFNVADAAITFGVVALLYDALLKPEVRAGNDGA